MVTVRGRRQGWRWWLLGLLLMSRRDHDVRMLRRLHRLLLMLRLGRMMRLGVQHPSWYRRRRQLLILHRAAHPITSRAHLITSRGTPFPPLSPLSPARAMSSADNDESSVRFLSLVSERTTLRCRGIFAMREARRYPCLSVREFNWRPIVHRGPFPNRFVL